MKDLCWASVILHVKFIKYVQNLSPSHCSTAFTMVQTTITLLWMTGSSCLYGFSAFPFVLLQNLHSAQNDSFRCQIFNSSTQNPPMACGCSPEWDSCYLGLPLLRLSHTCSLNGPQDSRHSLVWGFFPGHCLTLEGPPCLAKSHALFPHLFQIFAGISLS